jgi:hypothetical protein
MPEELRPGDGIVFMKVGTHANEPLSEIIQRKQREIDDAGFALWGYGGNTCHPLTSVQPFAHDYTQRQEPIYLVMQPMESKHFAVQDRAKDYSVDGIHWEEIPPEINVLGSRFALAIDSLDEKEFELSLAHTQVAVGNHRGRRGDTYIRGHVDKACLAVTAGAGDLDEVPPVRIGLVAHMVEPYAVLLRN